MAKLEIDDNVIKSIIEIVKRGNDAEVRKKNGNIVVLEVKKTIKYSTQ